MAGYQFETPAMVDDMLEHLEATPGALPLLQFAATQLWEARDTQRKLLTLSAYRAWAASPARWRATRTACSRACPRRSERWCAPLFLRLVTPERTRAIVSVDELRELTRDAGEVQRLIDQLVQARLLVVQTGGGATGATVEIVHESLIHSWPTLKQWLDEGQEDAAFLEQLRNAARQWQAKNARPAPALARRAGGGGAALPAALPRRAAPDCSRTSSRPCPRRRRRAGG